MPFVEIPSDVKALPKSDIPGILAGAIYDADSDDEDVLIRHYCETKHFERTIDEAVRNGHLQPRAPGTCLPMRMATPTSVITVADLAQFLADIQCSVEIRRVEVNAAQPQAAPLSNGPLPLTTSDIAFCFDGIQWSEKKWRKPLGYPPKWLKNCIAIPGQRGVSETRWNPVLIAAALVQNGHVQARSVRARFQSKPQLSEWLDAWKTYEADYLDND